MWWWWVKENEPKLLRFLLVPAPVFFYWWLPRMRPDVAPAELSPFLYAFLVMGTLGVGVMTLESFLAYLERRTPKTPTSGPTGSDLWVWLALRLAASGAALYVLLHAPVNEHFWGGLIWPAALLVSLCLALQALCAVALAARLTTRE